jgi:ribosome biogenesis GTPase
MALENKRKREEVNAISEYLLTDEIRNEDRNDELVEGVVIRKGRGQYVVQTTQGNIPCVLSAMLRKNLIYPLRNPNSLPHYQVQSVGRIEMVDPLAIGDVVWFLDAGDGTGLVKEVAERKNTFSRRDPGPIPLEQVMVANVDQLIAVFSVAQPKPSWRLLDRYLVLAEIAKIPTTICITKMDLLRSAKLESMVGIYQELGYQIVFTSVMTGEGIEQFRQLLQGRLSVFAGKSGVGKTSLLNAMQPGLGLRVKSVYKGKEGKGRHTTSHLEMFPLSSGGWIVDTPGMRELGLWNMDVQDVAFCFKELRPYLGKCKFGGSCLHRSEPDCAIKNAVDNGAVQRHRYESFLVMSEEVN